ncbi:hypothetical protein ACFQFQ_07880 [Sulfitobacter porphyrae]|uniref:Secreted protein n=1 Tax=Sulfitobacter porphyrae TaxID=1246864 RepID=A0ABW2B229_9RHOB
MIGGDILLLPDVAALFLFHPLLASTAPSTARRFRIQNNGLPKMQPMRAPHNGNAAMDVVQDFLRRICLSSETTMI